MNDTRKDARLSVALVTRYREPAMLEPREGECHDLSLSGMFITTQRPSPRGALIRFECIGDRPEDGFRGTGRVVWQRNKQDDRGPAGMGVRFVRLESGGREALERTIERVGSERPLSRTPRPSNRAPANARARQEEALTQAVPIFAAGTPTSSTATAQPAVQTPIPPAHSTNTARFPQLRSSTLRGVAAVSGEARRVSSNPPPGTQGVGNTPLPPPPRTPLPAAPARGGSNGDPRERLDRTRRGVGPQGPENDAATGYAAQVSEKPDSDRPNAVVDARTGTDSDRPAAGKSRSDRPVRSVASAATQNGSAASNGSERAPRERQSDRPPQPGGVDDFRARAAPSAASAATPDSGLRPRDVAFARTTLKEMPAGFREGEPASTEPEPRFASAARQLSANAGFPRAERDTTEKRIPIVSDIARNERGSSPEFEQERGGSRSLLWVIAGTGLLMSYLVVRMFGGALPGIPGEAIKPEVASNANAASTNSAAAETRAPYTLAVSTQPPGARVSAAGQSVIAPGELHLDGLQPPLQVVAELAGYTNASMTVWPSQFVRNGNGYEGKLELTLQTTSNAAEAPAQPPVNPSHTQAQAQAQAPRAPVKPHDVARSDVPAHTTAAAASAGRRSSDSQTPARRASKPATSAPVATTPAAPNPPSPEVSIVPVAAAVASSSSGSQQTPMAEALDCLARGDNRCVIRALEDKAGSAREFELLIETYRAVGSTPRAEREMQAYLERFPEGQRAPEYRRLLERRAPSPAAEAATPTPQAQ